MIVAEALSQEENVPAVMVKEKERIGHEGKGPRRKIQMKW